MADRIARDMEREGLHVWIDRRSIEFGTPDWEASVRQAVNRSYALVLVCTPNTHTSSYVHAELQLAKESGCRIIPVWVLGERWTDCVPLGLISYQRVDLREELYPSGMLELLSQLRREAAGRGRAQRETDEEPRPPAHDMTPDMGHLALLARQGRVERQVRRVQHQLRLVRPILGLNLPHVNFERDAHYLSRSMEHFEPRRLKPEDWPKAVTVTTSDLQLVERLSKEGTHLGLKAEAGMGKSALLEQLAHTCAVLAAQAPAVRPLPLLIRLGDVRGRADLVTQLERQLLRQWEGELEASDLVGCEFIAFIDGLDELPADEGSQWLEKAVENSLLDLIGEGIEVGRLRLRARSSILTSRPEGIHRCNLLPHFRSDYARKQGEAPQILELKRFDARDQATFVRRFFHPHGEERPGSHSSPDLSERLIQALQTEGSAAGVADTPLLLFLLCYLNSHGAAAPELTLPNTAPQLLFAGIRHTLTRRDSQLNDAHLTACACLAFEHRMRGSLTTEEAAAAVAALCQDDLADSVQGLAARLNIRRAPVNELPTIDRAGLTVLVRDVLSARTGLFLLAGEYIRPTDIRAGDVLAAYHLQRLTRLHGFGFNHLSKRAEPAMHCILDPHRALAARETVAQAVGRWAWDERKWRYVIQSLGVLLVEAGDAAPLITLLGESDAIEGINPLGDDDGGHRLIVAVDCWQLAKIAAPGCNDLKMLAHELKAEGLRRRAHHPALRRAMERLEGREPHAPVGVGSIFDLYEEEPLPTPLQELIERLEQKHDSYQPLVECLREIRESGATPGELSVPMLHRLADSILDAQWQRMSYDTLRDTLKVIRLDALKHFPFLARVTSARALLSDRFPDLSVRDILLKTPLEQALIGTIDDPVALRALVGLQLDQSLEMFHAVSDGFTGRERSPVAGIDGRLVTPETTRTLAEYIESGLPGGWGTSAQYSAIGLLTRLMPSNPGEHEFLTPVLCKVLERGEVEDFKDFQDGFLVLRYIAQLGQYKLDYDALLSSVFVFADKFANERNLGVIVSAALYCRAHTTPQAALDGVRELISRFSRARDEVLLSVISFDFDTVQELGMLDAAIDLADTDPDWGTSSMYRNAGMSFITRNIDKLMKDEAFVTDVIDSLHERGRFFWAEDIARLVLGASRDTGFAERLLRLSAMADRPRRLVDELINNNAALLFDAGLRFRRSDDLETFEWVETSATLAAGYVVGAANVRSENDRDFNV